MYAVGEAASVQSILSVRSHYLRDLQLQQALITSVNEEVLKAGRNYTRSLTSEMRSYQRAVHVVNMWTLKGVPTCCSHNIDARTNGGEFANESRCDGIDVGTRNTTSVGPSARSSFLYNLATLKLQGCQTIRTMTENISACPIPHNLVFLVSNATILLQFSNYASSGTLRPTQKMRKHISRLLPMGRR